MSKLTRIMLRRRLIRVTSEANPHATAAQVLEAVDKVMEKVTDPDRDARRERFLELLKLIFSILLPLLLEDEDDDDADGDDYDDDGTALV